MDAVKFLEEWKRMCNSYEADCQECPSYMLCHATTPFGEMDNLQELVAYVEKWSAEHPIKTRLMDFLEKYPDALTTTKGMPRVSPRLLGYCKGKDDDMACLSCEHGKKGLEFCWNLPLEG